MAVTSFVRDRGRAVGVAAVVAAMSASLLSAPAAFGAVDGDPIANSSMVLKFSGAFKKKLRNNGVKMNAKGFNIVRNLTSDVDPTTGRGDLRLGKIVFKKGKNRVIYSNLKGSVPGNAKSSQSGKLFKLSAPASVERQGYGAAVNGVKMSFVKGAAKKLNRRLNLNSLRAGSAGSFSFEYKPETVKIIGGTAQTLSAAPNLSAPLLGGSVGAKLLLGHCVNGTGDGFLPVGGAQKEVIGAFPNVQVRFTFPVVTGEISPDATEGLSETSGGIQIQKTDFTSAPCNNGLDGELTQQSITTDITARTVSSEVNIAISPAPAGTTAGPGPKGRAVGQNIDPTNTVITISPKNRTFTLSGSVVQLAPVSAQTLNGVFPCVSNCDDGGDPGNATLMGGDIFGTSTLTVTTR